jgi:hypothetical protein
MIFRRSLALALVAWSLCNVDGVSRCWAQQTVSLRVQDNTLGVAFREIGAVEKIDASTYRMMLISSNAVSPQHAVAEVSASNRMFVNLPGTYGGRFYLDRPSASPHLSKSALVDSVEEGGRAFRREYWTVYAGMGMWEGVISCSARAGGRYYIVSFVQDLPLGKPGEEAGGEVLRGEELQTRCLSSLRDTSNALVRQFLNLLSSVQITPQ